MEITKSADLTGPEISSHKSGGDKNDYNFSHKEIMEFFDRPADVDQPWMFQIRLKQSLKSLDTREMMNQQIVYDNFDNMQCICLEIQYQKFQRSAKAEFYRYVKLNR